MEFVGEHGPQAICDNFSSSDLFFQSTDFNTISLSLCVYNIYIYIYVCVCVCVCVCVKKDEMGRACSTNGEKRSAYRILVGKPEGKRPLGRPRRRWEDNIRMDFREMGWGGMDWIYLAQDREGPLENPCENGNEPSGSI
jgi:hypothetical protein